MLAELTVRNLGVIEDLTLLLGPGMTALTGETGAGKTLVVEAIELLVGGRADGVLVRPGASEASVEGRFVLPDGNETVLARVVPAEGRSRAYIDGRMATVGALAEVGEKLVDLHGQHAHQSLLSPAVQRSALDRFAGVDLGPLQAARQRVREIDDGLAALGGDERARAREIDLLRFQVEELAAAGLFDADEDRGLEVEEDLLADATAHREAAAAAHAALDRDAAALDTLGVALAAIHGRPPFTAIADRLRSAMVEVRDVAGELRDGAEAIADDPERLAAVRARRQLLRDLQRKYGESLADVIAFAESAARRLAELESFDARAAALDADRAKALARVRDEEAALGGQRRAAAGGLSAAVESHLRTLALPHARFDVSVGERDPGDDVMFGLSANRGEPVLPLVKVASGGELARTMLAARLVLSGGPPTLVFDEVDAGIGGEAALAVGRALSALRGEADAQVLVVTHLAQVAAFARNHVAVSKDERDGRTVATAHALAAPDRVVELSRMLSGQPDSAAARKHAAELLKLARGAPAGP
jgi:DNA repair protein RecN (Recombination protein N)